MAHLPAALVLWAAVASAGTGKRGLCGHTCNSSLLFSPAARSWQYNYATNLSTLDAGWATRPECRALASTLDYVPMVAHCSPLDCSALSSAPGSIDRAATALLGFNEPNGNPDACADRASKACRKMCLPATAAAKWPEFEKLAAAASPPRRLGTPAPGGLWKGLGTADRPVPWLQDWVSNCTALYGARGCHFDFVAVHYYECWGNTTALAELAAADMMAFLERVHALFGKPVWLTEFNCGDSSGPTADQPPENHLRFMKAALPKLEAAPFVERYSWFFDEPGRPPSLTSVADPAADPEGGGGAALTELGRFYNSAAAAAPAGADQV